MSQHNVNSTFDSPAIHSVLAALVHEDSLKIFVAAKAGITSSMDTIKALRLTQKRYYTRLRGLMKAGLIERLDTGYHLTTLGRICYSLGEGLHHAITHHDHLELADRLQQSTFISIDASKQILQALSRNGFLGAVNLADVIHPVKMLSDYEQLVAELVDRIDKAEQVIYLASYYTDSRVIEALIRALHRGVPVALVSDLQETMTQKLRLVKMLLVPKLAKLLLNLITNHKIRVKQHALQYSFCILDNTHVIMELPNQLTRVFHVGFSLESRELSRSLAQTFYELCRRGGDDPIFSMLRRKLQSDNHVTSAEQPLSFL